MQKAEIMCRKSHKESGSAWLEPKGLSDFNNCGEHFSPSFLSVHGQQPDPYMQTMPHVTEDILRAAGPRSRLQQDLAGSALSRLSLLWSAQGRTNHSQNLASARRNPKAITTCLIAGN